jgi:hypothetical protein
MKLVSTASDATPAARVNDCATACGLGHVGAGRAFLVGLQECACSAQDRALGQPDGEAGDDCTQVVMPADASTTADSLCELPLAATSPLRHRNMAGRSGKCSESSAAALIPAAHRTSSSGSSELDAALSCSGNSDDTTGGSSSSNGSEVGCSHGLGCSTPDCSSQAPPTHTGQPAVLPLERGARPLLQQLLKQAVGGNSPAATSGGGGRASCSSSQGSLPDVPGVLVPRALEELWQQRSGLGREGVEPLLAENPDRYVLFPIQ